MSEPAGHHRSTAPPCCMSIRAGRWVGPSLACLESGTKRRRTWSRGYHRRISTSAGATPGSRHRTRPGWKPSMRTISPIRPACLPNGGASSRHCRRFPEPRCRSRRSSPGSDGSRSSHAPGRLRRHRRCLPTTSASRSACSGSSMPGASAGTRSPTSIRLVCARSRPSRNCSPHTTASPRPTWRRCSTPVPCPAPTGCRCARSSTAFGPSTAGRSAGSTCTSSTRPRNAGCRRASNARAPGGRWNLRSGCAFSRN